MPGRVVRMAFPVPRNSEQCAEHRPRLPDPGHIADAIDPSIEFLYTPHMITVLILVLATLSYSAFYIPADLSGRAGLGAIVCIFLLFAMMAFKDGPFIRPHPAFWRLVLAAHFIYILGITYALFQDVDWARKVLAVTDSSLGVPLPEQSYADDCSLSWKNIMSKMDEFVIAHALGWFCKAIIIRDYWFCWILSVMFELCEYSLEHQLPNFAECWWDHWILDVLLCNWIGTHFGMKACEYFEMKRYSWRGFNEIPSVSGKVRRAMAQFTPHSWVKFQWRATESIKNYGAVLFLLVFFLACELNAFYLKYILWIPPSNMFNIYRLALYFFVAIPATREAYQYLTDANFRRLGVQSWLVLVSIGIETLICIKFGEGMFPAPTPKHVVVFWVVFVLSLSLYALLHFGVPTIRKYFARNPHQKTR